VASLIGVFCVTVRAGIASAINLLDVRLTELGDLGGAIGAALLVDSGS
jgi:hypothetical protein